MHSLLFSFLQSNWSEHTKLPASTAKVIQLHLYVLMLRLVLALLFLSLELDVPSNCILRRCCVLCTPFAATIILVSILVHHCVMGIYLIASNAAGSPGDRGYSLVTGLVLPTLAMLQGFYDLLIEAKSAADQNICRYNILSRFKAYMLHVPEPHSSGWTHVWLFLGALVGG